MKIATKLLIATLAATALLGGTVAVPAQATTASAVQAHTQIETTKTTPQPNKRTSQLGVHNGSSRVIYVGFREGRWVDGTSSANQRAIQPGATAFISGDGGYGVDIYDVRAYITSDGGGSSTYVITANNTWVVTEGATSIAGSMRHVLSDPRPGNYITELGTINKATLVYGREAGGTEFWDVYVANK